MYPNGYPYPAFPYTPYRGFGGVPAPFPARVPASPLAPLPYPSPVPSMPPVPPMPTMGKRYSQAYLDLQNLWRSLWEQHIAWTRMTVDTIVDSVADEKATTERLLRNATDMGNAVRSVYGEPAGKQFEGLIRDHLVIAATLVKQLKARQRDAAEATKKKWYDNADDIAAFLAKANPQNWTYDEWKAMMHEHLDILTKQVLARLQKNYPLNIQVYDKGREQALGMADMLSEGIAKQFPSQFG